MSYEAEKKRLIEEFESVVGTIRKDYGLKHKSKPKTLESENTAQPQRATNRH